MAVRRIADEGRQPVVARAAESVQSLAALRIEIEVMKRELIDLAFDLERRGRTDAADLASAVAVQLGDLSAAGGSEEP